MIAEFRLPDLGEGLAEAEIVQWLVAEGDPVALNQPIAEVETAKAVVELPAPFAGTVHRLHAGAGDTVAVGSALIDFDTPAAGDAQAAPRPEPNLVGYGAPARGSDRPRRRARSGGRGAPASIDRAAPMPGRGQTPGEGRERPRSTPPVRLLAKRLGVDLDLVEPAAPGDLITRADVERTAGRTGTSGPDEPRGLGEPGGPSRLGATGSPGGPGSPRETRVPVRGVRKATAAAMVRSAFTAPHATCFLEVDVTETQCLVAELRADPRLAEHRIGILAVVARAVCLALRAEPALNARWDDARAEIVQYHHVDLGIATATERGLVVPHIADADALGLTALADALDDLVRTARAGRKSPAALSGGTFSITNYGVFGIDAGTPILNPPQAGILGVGAVRRRPWEHGGAVALRDVLTLSLSFEQSVVDGAECARILRTVGDLLANPGRALLLT